MSTPPRKPAADPPPEETKGAHRILPVISIWGYHPTPAQKDRMRGAMGVTRIVEQLTGKGPG